MLLELHKNGHENWESFEGVIQNVEEIRLDLAPCDEDGHESCRDAGHEDWAFFDVFEDFVEALFNLVCVRRIAVKDAEFRTGFEGRCEETLASNICVAESCLPTPCVTIVGVHVAIQNHPSNAIGEECSISSAQDSPIA